MQRAYNLILYIGKARYKKMAKAHARLPISAGHYEKCSKFGTFTIRTHNLTDLQVVVPWVSSRGGGILRASATQLGHERRLGLFGLRLESGRHKQTLYAPSKPTGYLGRYCTGPHYQRMRANNTVIDGTLASLSEYDTDPCRLYQLDPLRRRSWA